jgi:hypothetical protein
MIATLEVHALHLIVQFEVNSEVVRTQLGILSWPSRSLPCSSQSITR